MLSLFILVPFLLLILLNLPLSFFREKAAFWMCAGVLFAQSTSVLLHPLRPWSTSFDPGGAFFSFQLFADTFSLVMLFTIGLVAFVSLLVAQGTFIKEQQKFHFINLLLISVMGMNTAVLVRDIFSLYIFIEVIAVSTFVLMAVENNKFAVEGTFKYLVLSAIASVFMLSAIALFILMAGNTTFVSIHNSFYAVRNTPLLNFAVGLFLCGIFIKSGVVPFHGWVADAYSDTQASVSVLLAGIITKISGVYVLLRLFTSVFFLTPAIQSLLLFVGMATILFAALAALTQTDMKRMLAYSSISQVGYIVLALGAGTPLAFAGAVFHFFNHAVFKSLLFVNTASLEKRFGSTDMTLISGFKVLAPVTRATSIVGMLSTAGVPPLSGFWSKLIIIIALWNSGHGVYAAAALLASVITLAYFLSLQRQIFFKKSDNLLEPATKVSFGITFSEILLAVVVIGVGVGVPFVLRSWILPLQTVITG